MKDHQKWAQEVLENLKLHPTNIINCGTLQALLRLSRGEEFNYIATYSPSFPEETLAITTDDLKTEYLHISSRCVIKFTDVKTLVNDLKKSSQASGIQVLSYQTENDSLVKCRLVGTSDIVIWSENPEQTLAEHQSYRFNQFVSEISRVIDRNIRTRKKYPSNQELTSFIQEANEIVPIPFANKIKFPSRRNIRNIFSNKDNWLISGGPFGVLLLTIKYNSC